MYKISVSAAALLLLSMPAFAADNMGMSMSGPKAGAIASTDYRFALAAPPQSAGGKSTVEVRLLHGGQPMSGAIVIQSRAARSR